MPKEATKKTAAKAATPQPPKIPEPAAESEPVVAAAVESPPSAEDGVPAEPAKEEEVKAAAEPSASDEAEAAGAMIVARLLEIVGADEPAALAFLEEHRAKLEALAGKTPPSGTATTGDFEGMDSTTPEMSRAAGVALKLSAVESALAVTRKALDEMQARVAKHDADAAARLAADVAAAESAAMAVAEKQVADLVDAGRLIVDASTRPRWVALARSQPTEFVALAASLPAGVPTGIISAGGRSGAAPTKATRDSDDPERDAEQYVTVLMGTVRGMTREKALKIAHDRLRELRAGDGFHGRA